MVQRSVVIDATSIEQTVLIASPVDKLFPQQIQGWYVGGFDLDNMMRFKKLFVWLRWANLV
jgi:hypothetical protein